MEYFISGVRWLSPSHNKQIHFLMDQHSLFIMIQTHSNTTLKVSAYFNVRAWEAINTLQPSTRCYHAPPQIIPTMQHGNAKLHFPEKGRVLQLKLNWMRVGWDKRLCFMFEALSLLLFITLLFALLLALLCFSGYFNFILYDLLYFVVVGLIQ